MKRYLAILIAVFACLSKAEAQLDQPELQPKAGQAQMDAAYDMTTGNADLVAALHYGTHQHGAASLSILLDSKNDQSLIILTAPAHNLLGFERETLTEADKQKLTSLTQTLKAWDTLFTFQPANHCKLLNHEVQLLPDDSEQVLAAKTGFHSDLEVTWTLQCTKLSATQSVHTHLFTAFPSAFKWIHTDWLTAQHAGIQELKQDRRVEFSPQNNLK